MKNLNDRWDKTLEMLREEMSEPAYNAWISPFYPISIDENKNILYIETEREYVVERLNNRYLQLLEGAVNNAFDKPLSVVAKVKKIVKEKSVRNLKKKEIIPSSADFDQEYYLNPKFNFDNFVVGKNNEFAYSVAYAVAKDPAKNYNPLFIYGASGLGKTHLMHAIGHYILENYPEKKVLYVSSEMFTNELINAIRVTDSINLFQNKYRNIDVLLIDDIQFLEGKTATQDEFFHTFNTLYDRNKQIIISSDRSPQKLSKLDERLTSRFLWNVTVDIQPPDYETRVAILRSKAEMEKIEVTDEVSDVINLIAEMINHNVRELEGALTNTIGLSRALNKPIDMNFAKIALKDIISESNTKIDVDLIKKVVTGYYGITIKEIDSSKRTKNITLPRQIAMYLCKEFTDNSLPKIGKAFGGRDHTTVMHAHKKVMDLYKTDIDITESIDDIISKLKNS